MNSRTIGLFLYGVLLLVGGIIGHLKAHSTASLVMGIFSSQLIIMCSVLIYKKQPLGYVLGRVLVGLLCAFFMYRFFLTGKMMPSGLMAMISIVIGGILWIPAKVQLTDT